jgi:peptide/nickel transport system substrate-binding protein
VITQIVGGTPQTIVVTATPEPETEPETVAKDTLIIGAWQEPRGFLDYANSQAIRVEVQLLYRPRWVTRLNGGLQPNPALIDGDLPSFENGGARLVDVTVKPGEAMFDLATKSVIPATEEAALKQLVVTGKIKSGLKWDDGEPLTAGDFVFAWQLNCSPDSGALDVTYCPMDSVPGAGGIVSKYEAKDDTTLELTFTPGALDPTYQVLLFGPESDSGPQPEHLFKDMSPADILKDERATGGTSATPLGFGPYKMTEWKKGESITFEANEHWSGDPPKTPTIIYKFFADSVGVASAVIAGDIDVSSGGTTGLSIDQFPYLTSVAKNGDIVFEIDKTAASFEYLQLNFNDPQDKSLKAPHPLLSDFKVRKAIALAINRQQMVDTIYFGQAAVVDQPQLPHMPSYDTTQGIVEFDPEGAKALMDEAGWTDSDGDGIREKDGVKASVTLITTSGNPVRQKSTQIMQSNLLDIGIEVNLNYQPSSVVFSTDVLYSRAFEMITYGSSFSIVDPGNWWYGNAACAQIPTPDNGLSGGNYSGWCDEAASNASTEANFETLDPEKRKAAWDLALKSYFETGYNIIPLFIKPGLLGLVPELQGPKLDPTEYITWNAHTWVASEMAE